MPTPLFPGASRLPQTAEEWYVIGGFTVIYALLRWWYQRWKKQNGGDE